VWKIYLSIDSHLANGELLKESMREISSKKRDKRMKVFDLLESSKNKGLLG